MIFIATFLLVILMFFFGVINWGMVSNDNVYEYTLYEGGYIKKIYARNKIDFYDFEGRYLGKAKDLCIDV